MPKEKNWERAYKSLEKKYQKLKDKKETTRDSDFYIVSLSDCAFFTIVSAALEAYKVSHPENNGNHVPIETYGNLWGYQVVTKRDEFVLRVVLADVDTSATRTPDSVRPVQEAFTTKVEFVDRFLPELEYLGDFHSHPYDFENDGVNNVLELERSRLYEFSQGDFEHIQYLQEEKSRHYRLGIAATVFEMSEYVARKNKHVKDFSCIRFMYDRMAIWIKAYIFSTTDFEKMRDDQVGLICPILGFHAESLEIKD